MRTYYAYNTDIISNSTIFSIKEIKNLKNSKKGVPLHRFRQNKAIARSAHDSGA